MSKLAAQGYLRAPGLSGGIWGSALGDPQPWAQQLYPTWGSLLRGGSLLVLSYGCGAPSP